MFHQEQVIDVSEILLVAKIEPQAFMKARSLSLSSHHFEPPRANMGVVSLCVSQRFFARDGRFMWRFAPAVLQRTPGTVTVTSVMWHGAASGPEYLTSRPMRKDIIVSEGIEFIPINNKYNINIEI